MAYADADQIQQALLALFVTQAAVALRPDWPAVRALYPWAYGGFYVDERISRILLARWPVPDPTANVRSASSNAAGERS